MSKKSTNIFYLGFFLCAVCAIAAAIMGYAAAVTKEPIAKAKVRKTAELLKTVLPSFNNDPMKEKYAVGSDEILVVRNDGKIVGYAAMVSVKSGYGGTIKALVSFHPDGRIRTFAVTEHNETPGLGGNVADRSDSITFAELFRGKQRKAGELPPNEILDQYSGHSVTDKKDSWEKPWKITKDGGSAKYISGATISSRAVNELAWKAANAFAEYQKTQGGVKQ